MAKIDTAYSYYLSTYGNSNVSRYDTHKKSQLRDVYNRIVKLNKESPLYKISQSGDIQKFAIDIKEGTRNIQNIVASLSSDSGDSIESIFEKKIAMTSDESVVTAEYIGNNSESDDIDDFTVEVKQLAEPQINIGSYVNSKSSELAPGAYSFDLVTTKSAYEFQFNVNRGDTNYDIQDKLANLITNAGIGLSSEVITNQTGQSALRIESNQTGLNTNEDFLFHIMPQADNLSIQAMDLLGIDRVTSPAQNSEFLLNEKERSSFSNTFTVNKSFVLTLTGISEEGEAATVGFKPNADAVADNIQTLADAYNHMLFIGREHATEQDHSKLLSEISNVALSQKSSLSSIGLTVGDEGDITVERDILTDVVSSEDNESCFFILNQFKDSLSEKADNASLNPMKYVNKLIVSYKNPGKNFATPYITSIYSGMMLDRFC